MALFLCEKPSQARDIARVMGVTQRRDGYLEGGGKQVTWCIGHLLEMAKPDDYAPEWKSWRLETLPLLPQRWKLGVRKSVGKQFQVIKKLLKQTGEVVIATDADREGETIGREVLEQCGYRGQVSRLWLSALDDASIRKALQGILPGHRTEPLYQAGLGRSRADWLVGMNLTRAYTVLGRHSGYDGILTVGRVQTPTLKLVVDRDRLIENFKPVAYFEIFVQLQVKNGSFRAKWIATGNRVDAEGRCLEKKNAEEVLNRIQNQQGFIRKTETKRVQEPPPLPLELSTLQQIASRRWGLGAKKVLDSAQTLYETHKAITYPRTDCRYLPNTQFPEAPGVLQALAQSDPALAELVAEADVTRRSRAWNDGKITAHHAIIPTAARVNPQGMSPDEHRLYDLIRRHFLAQFYPAFEYDRTVIDAEVVGETFRASGNVIIAPGWKRVLAGTDKKEPDQAPPLPRVKQGEAARVQKAEMAEKKTTPPPRYTEGTLIQAMKFIGKTVEDPRFRKTLRETSGIGTEATRASIIENLLKRNLLAQQGKKVLISTPPGRSLVDILPKSVTNPATTAVWEQALEDIAAGNRTLEEFQEKAVTWVTRLVTAVKSGQTPIPRGLEGFTPPSPGQPTAPATTGHPSPLTCPQCKTGVLVERTAKKGRKSGSRFLGCRNYPRCTFTSPLDPAT